MALSTAKSSPQKTTSTALKDAVIDLRRFLTSPDGQDLICRTYECYNYIAMMAKWCRLRDSTGHQTIKIVAGCATATAGVVVIGATIAGSAGLAAPAITAGVVGAAGTASLTAGVVGITNALACLGFSQIEAQFVAQRIEQLRDIIGEWDTRAEAVIREGSAAGADLSDFDELRFEMRSAWAKVMKDRAAKEGRTEFLKESGEHLLLGGAGEGMHAAVHAGVHAGAHAGGEVLTQAAEGLLCGCCGLECMAGLHKALEGAKDMRKQRSMAADELDAQADNFCSILHMMMTAANGTPAYQQLVGLVPQLIYVKVSSCKVPRAECRLGQSTIEAYKSIKNKTLEILNPFKAGKVGQGFTPTAEVASEDARDAEIDAAEAESDREQEESPTDVKKPKNFFVIRLEPRSRDTRHLKCHLIPDAFTEVDTEIFLRRFATDDTVSVEALKLSGAKGKILGDRRMGEKVKFSIEKLCDTLQVASDDGTSIFTLAYEIAGNFLSEEEQHRFADLCKKQNWAAVKAELARQPGLVNVQPRGSNSKGGQGRKRWSALHQAAKGGNEEMVQFLLAQGAARDATTEERDGQSLTPVDVASTDAVRQLFETADAEVADLVTRSFRVG